MKLLLLSLLLPIWAQAACTDGTLGVDYFYGLVEVPGSDPSDASYPGTDSDGAVRVISEPITIPQIPMSNAAARCGSKWTGSAWAIDTRYPTSGVYTDTFVVHLSTQKCGRIRNNIFYRNYTPSHGTQFSTVERLVTGTCSLLDQSLLPHYFYKSCVRP